MAASTSSSTVSDPSEFTLISSDNRKFFIPSTAASLSAVIKHQLRNKAWPQNVVVLENYDGKALEPVAEYLRVHGNTANDEEMKRRFDSEFLSGNNLSADALFDTALNLEIPGLVDLVSGKISDSGYSFSNRDVEWARQAFKDDLASTDEENEGGAREDLPIPTPTEDPGQCSVMESQSFTSSSSSSGEDWLCYNED